MHPSRSFLASSLLSALVVMASCNGQVPTSTKSEANDRPSPLAQAVVDTAQISDYIVAALEDSKGNLWFGTLGQGAAYYDGKALRYLSLEEGLIGDVVTDIAEDRDGRLWFGTQTGASRYDPSAAPKAGGRTFTGFGPAEGLTGAGCKLLVDRNGTLWAGTSDGVFRLNRERFEAFELPIPKIDGPSYKMTPGKIWDLFEDSKGNIWFGRDGYGACKYDPSATLRTGGRNFTLFTKVDGLCSNNVASIVEDPQGNIWFGSITSDFPPIQEGGVARYDASASLRTGVKTFAQFPEVNGLTANDIYNLYRDRSGNIWIGAVRVGAYRYDPSTSLGASGSAFTLFDRTDRPDLTKYFGIQAFVEDRQGTKWFGFSGGLFRFNGATFVNVTRGGPWEP
ncbi:MAG: two-component regulator propeller domain-containing protein [Flavobacteriales bacterium]